MQSIRSFTRRAALATALASIVAATPVAFAAPVISAGRIDVASARQARSVEAFRAIHEGMSSNEVAARLGAPDNRMRFEATRTTAWDYEYQDTWGYSAEFSVIFNDAGVVVGKVSVRHDA